MKVEARAPWFVCLTADVVASRSDPDRRALQLCLEQSIQELNAEFAATLIVPFTVTLGDEVQALLPDLATALDVDLRLRRTLYPRRLHCGIGVGPVATPLRARTAEMDGPCFLRAREALEAGAGEEATTVVRSALPEWDDPLNAILLLLNVISGRWSDKQMEAIETYARFGTQTAASRQLGISQPAFRKRLESARARHYLEARRLLRSFAVRLWTGAGRGEETKP